MKKRKIKVGRLELDVYTCSNLLESARGLMFRKLSHDEGMIIKFPEFKINGIHMLFVFYAIDVFWLDENYKVVNTSRNVRPFSLYTNSGAKARYALETRANAIKKDIAGKRIIFKSKDF